MPGLRTPFLLRRIASAWPLLASLMLTVFIAAALLAALATFNAQVLPQAARRQLASSAQTGMAVSGPVSATVARADMPASAPPSAARARGQPPAAHRRRAHRPA